MIKKKKKNILKMGNEKEYDREKYLIEKTLRVTPIFYEEFEFKKGNFKMPEIARTPKVKRSNNESLKRISRWNNLKRKNNRVEVLREDRYKNESFFTYKVKSDADSFSTSPQRVRQSVSQYRIFYRMKKSMQSP